MVNRSPRRRYITSWKEFRFLPGSLRALRRLAERGWPVIIVSNQAGVGHGLYSRRTLREITTTMLRHIRGAGGRVRAVYYCTHRPQDCCACRKPKPGMLRQASRSFGIELRRSFLIGDNETDLRVGRAAGCRTVLVLSGMTRRVAVPRLRVRPDHVSLDLTQAVGWVLQQP